MSKKPNEWPPSLRRWLEKSLTGLNPKQIQLVQEELKSIVRTILEHDAVWKIDWDLQRPHKLGQTENTIASFMDILRPPPPPVVVVAPPPPVVVGSRFSALPPPAAFPFHPSPPTAVKITQYQPQQPIKRVKPDNNTTDDRALLALVAKGLRDFLLDQHIFSVFTQFYLFFSSRFCPSNDHDAIRTCVLTRLVHVCEVPNSQLKYIQNGGGVQLILEDDKDVVTTTQQMASARSARFSQQRPSSTTPPPPPPPSNTNSVLVGTCQILEKNYLRSSSEAPDPSLIRPEPVLKLALVRLQKKLEVEGPAAYSYCCDQLKAIRQDLKYQHLENAFSQHVYESNARIAIEYGGPDMNELNACLTQLKDHQVLLPEFSNYLTFYHVFSKLKYQNASTQTQLSQTIPTSSSNTGYALYRLVHTRDWASFLILSEPSSLMSKYEACLCLPIREYARVMLLKTFCLSAHKQIKLPFIQHALRFPSLAELREWVRRINVHVDMHDGVDVKLALERINEWLNEGRVWGEQ